MILYENSGLIMKTSMFLFDFNKLRLVTRSFLWPCVVLILGCISQKHRKLSIGANGFNIGLWRR